MEQENALIDFLVYSYFEIIPEGIYNESEYYKNHKDCYNDYCTKMVIIKAYSDATNEGAYNTLFKKEIPNIDELKKSSDKAKKESATVLLNSLKKYEETNDFDTWHNTLCTTIVNNYSNVKGNVKEKEQQFFTYGNAQKWVNMTLKYLWLFGLLPDYIKEDLHIPIDSFIIDALWKNKDIKLPLRDEKKKRDYSYKQPSNYVKPWSQWEYKTDYTLFRDSMQKTDYNLSWENEEWIKMSELRKYKERDDRYKGFFEA